MKMKQFLILVFAGLVFGSFAFISTAQDSGGSAACPALVQQALTAAGSACSSLGRNQICYGNNQAEAFDAEQQTLTSFSEVGDTVSIADIASLKTAPFSPENNLWGVALLSLQANIPDTLPGQAVNFIVYGDSEITPVESDNETYAAPMQAFMLSTGIGLPGCKEAPHDGVLVQSPDGVKVNFLVNGIEIEIGSTVLLDKRLDEKLWVSTLEGEASVTSAGETQIARPGFKVVTIPGNPPAAPAPYGNADVQGLPVSLLPKPVVVPFIVEGLAGTQDWVSSDYAVVAGTEYTFTTAGTVNIYPDCTDSSPRSRGTSCADMRFGPVGSTGLGIAPAGFPLPGETVGALVARINDGVPFMVGEGITLTPEADGVLSFRLNDTLEPDNNTGAFIVIVEETTTE